MTTNRFFLIAAPLIVATGLAATYAPRIGGSASSAGALSGARFTLSPAIAVPPAVTVARGGERGDAIEIDADWAEAAQVAWRFAEANYHAESGLFGAHANYQFVTVWDVASGLAILHSAHRLGLIDETTFRQRMDRSLATIRDMLLYRGIAYNKLYDSRTGKAVGRDEKPTTSGFGWSALDMGRFLVWMKIIEGEYPEYAAQIESIIGRMDLPQLVEDGHIMGEDLAPSDGTVRRYAEGRVGYEQYAAEGFKLWGQVAGKSLDFRANATPVTVNGVELLDDNRGNERLTSEPFIMMGLELGWPDEHWSTFGRGMLEAQEERYRQTGQITMVSEDAIPVQPYYFYYYSVYNNGDGFTVAAPVDGVPNLNSPRWISAKAAFAWHALLPSDYTSMAVDAVAAAATEEGWGSGVYEGSGTPTGMASINTAAVVLESALYASQGAPLIGRP